MMPLIGFQELWSAFPEALCAGLLIALVCSFIGVFVVLKRLVFLGATLLESAACGIAAAFYFHVHPFAGALVLTIVTATILAFPAEERRIPRDALMAFIFVLTSAMSMLFVSGAAAGLDEVKALLYGDLIITTREDLKILCCLLLPAVFPVLIFLRPILYTFVDREGARVLRIRVRGWELLFFYMTALIISASSKLGGMILVFSHLVVPPMAGLLLCSSLAAVFVTAGAAAVLATLAGFYISFTWDLPANQVIAAVSCFLLVLAWAAKLLMEFLFGRRR